MSAFPPSSGPKPFFSWLHLSDIHFGHKDAEHEGDERLVLKALRHDLQKHRDRGLPPPDAILVTGDLAFSGSPIQYVIAKSWLLEIAKFWSLSEREIFIVAGNHDVDRSVDRTDEKAASLVRAIRDGTRNLDEALASAADRELLSRRLGPYLAFAANFPNLQQPDVLFWVHSLSRPTGPSVRLIGLNTAVLSADNDDKGHLRLGNQALAGTVGDLTDDELVLVLSHHPFREGWLADQASVDNWIRNSADIHLLGHVHDSDTEHTRSGTGAQIVRITAGAVHGDKLPPGVLSSHGYNFAAIYDNPRRVRIWPRRWSEKKKSFIVDTENTPEGQIFAEYPLRDRNRGGTTARITDSDALFEGPGSAPARPVANFWGRDEEIRSLLEYLSAPDEKTICVVASGIGGVGKTALVRHFVATHAKRLFSDGAAWLDGQNLVNELARTARRFGWAPALDPTPQQATAFLANELHGCAVLLVVDNLPTSADTTHLPIPGGKCRTLLTSRAIGLDRDLVVPTETIQLGHWTPAECREYLRHVVPRLVRETDEDLEALAVFVQGLPLAVRLIARALAGDRDRSVNEYHAKLEAEPLGTLDQYSGGPDRGIAATFLDAYRALPLTEQAVLRALAVCAQGTTIEIVSAITGVEDSAGEGALNRLADVSLADHRMGATAPWGLHDVLRMFVRSQPGSADSEKAHFNWVKAYLRRNSDPRAHDLLEFGISEFIAAFEHLRAARKNEEASALLRSAYEHLRNRGRYALLIGLLEPLCTDLATASLDRMQWLVILGRCYETQGNIPKAIDLYEQSLALSETLKDPEGQASALRALGNCYQALERNTQQHSESAIRYLRRALAIYRTLPRDDRRLEGEALGFASLGNYYAHRGEFQKAIRYHSRALAINRDARKDHGRLEAQASSQNSLGACYLEVGKLGEPRAIETAIEHLQDARALSAETSHLLGEAIALVNLGKCYRSLGVREKAVEQLDLALARYRAIGWTDSHPRVASALKTLSEIS